MSVYIHIYIYIECGFGLGAKPRWHVGKSESGRRHDAASDCSLHTINQLFENSIQMSDRGKQGKGQAEKEERGWGDME